MKEQSIFRVVKNAANPFVMIDKRNLEGAALSWKAKGILAYLLSRPDDWTINVTDIVNHGTDGEDAVRSGIDELIEAGHIARHAERAGGRFFRWVYEVYERPEAKAEPSPFPGFPDVVKPDVENKPLNNTDLTNITTTRGAPQKNFYSVYESNIGGLTSMTAELLKELETRYTLEWFEEAVKEAIKANVRKLNYVIAVLNRWDIDGYKAERKPAQSYTRKQPVTSGRSTPYVPQTPEQTAEIQKSFANHAANEADWDEWIANRKKESVNA